MNPLFFAFCLFAFFPKTRAQSDMPTLQKQLSAPAADSCQLLYELAKKYEVFNLDACFVCLKTALDVAQRTNNDFARAQTMFRIGYTYTMYLRNDAKALEWLNKAVAIAKKSHDNLNLARSYQYLGLIAGYQESDEVDELLSKALNYAQAANDWEVLTVTYDIIGTICFRQKKYKQAAAAHLNAMNACENHSPDDWLSYGLDYADELATLGKKEEAVAFCRRLESVGTKLSRSKGEFVYLMDLTRLDLHLKRYADADSLLQRALALEKAKTTPDTFHLTHIYGNVLRLNVEQGAGEKAYQTVADLTELQVASKLNRLTQDSKVKMVELKSAQDLEQKETEIALLDEQKKRQRLLLIGAIAIALLMATFIALLQHSKRRIERQGIELQELNAAKDRLLTIIAHDLRSPIGLLRESYDLLDAGLQSPEQTMQFLAKSKERVERMFRTVENLHVWSLAQRDSLQPKLAAVSLPEVVAEQVEFLNEFAEKKGVVLKNNLPPRLDVWADKGQLDIAIYNLLHNALKFTPTGGSVSISADKTDAERITLKIVDTGVGMTPTALLAQERAQKALTTLGTAKEKGSGLGLSLVKDVAKKNGGAFQIQSQLGVGTTVSMILKIA